MLAAHSRSSRSHVACSHDWLQNSCGPRPRPLRSSKMQLADSSRGGSSSSRDRRRPHHGSLSSDASVAHPNRRRCCSQQCGQLPPSHAPMLPQNGSAMCSHVRRHRRRHLACASTRSRAKCRGVTKRIPAAPSNDENLNVHCATGTCLLAAPCPCYTFLEFSLEI